MSGNCQISIATREIYASYRRSAQEAVLLQNDARCSGSVNCECIAASLAPLPPRFISNPLVRTIGTHCRDPSQRGLLALPSCRSRNIAQRYNKLHKRHMSKHPEDSMTYASRNEAIIVISEHLLTGSCAVSPTAGKTIECMRLCSHQHCRKS